MKKLFVRALISCAAAVMTAALPVQKAVLSNGIPVVMQEDHSNPMVSIIVVVATGSSNETPETSGLSHFLEHLLFDGTSTQTRPQISDRFDAKGIYNNAFSRDDYTAFMITAPKEFLADGLANLADMLLNSALPESEFPKERGVVVEEMKKTRDDPFNVLEDAFRTNALKGTPYALPTLGTEQVIATVPRETVLEYYKAHYNADHFSLVAVGDFLPINLLRLLNDQFGSLPRLSGADLPNPGFKPFAPKGRALDTAIAKTPIAYLSVAFPAPAQDTPDAVALDMLAAALNDENSPLAAALSSGKTPPATSFQAVYNAFRQSAYFEVDIALSDASQAQPALKQLLAALQGLPEYSFPDAELAGIRLGERAQTAFTNENFTYAAMDLAGRVGGGNFLSPDEYLNQMNNTPSADLQRVAKTYLAGGDYRAFLLKPEAAPATPQTPTPPAQPPKKPDFLPFFHTEPTGAEMPPLATRPSSLVPRPSVLAGEGAPAAPNTIKPTAAPVMVTPASPIFSPSAGIARKVLPNGLTLIAKQRPSSPVVAVHVLTKNRLLLEEAGQSGANQLAFLMLNKGTKSRTAAQIAQSLSDMAARFKANDDPSIPFDNYYNSRDYGYVRLEVLIEFSDLALQLFADILQNPTFPDDEFAKAKTRVQTLQSLESMDSIKTARNNFFAALFPGQPFGKPIAGDPADFANLDAAAVKAYYAKQFAPNNLIITIVADGDPQDWVHKIETLYANLPSNPAADNVTAPAMPDPITGATKKVAVDRAQTGIYAGRLMPGIASPDAPALRVLSLLLSKRIADEVREKRSLAYSVGAGLELTKSVAWFAAVSGTRTDQAQTARAAILTEITGFIAEPPGQVDIDRELNRYWGQQLRYHFSSINQAYYLGLYEYLGVGAAYDLTQIDGLRKVTPDQLVEAARKYFSNADDFTVSMAGRGL